MAEDIKIDDPELGQELGNALLTPIQSEEEIKKANADSQDDTPDVDDQEEIHDELGDPSEEEGELIDEDLDDEDGLEEDENLDDEDDTDGEDNFPATVEVQVNGQVERVTLDDLKASYSGRQGVEAKMQEAAEMRKSAYDEAQNAYAARQQYAQKLGELEKIVQSVTPQEPDWNALQSNPDEYNRARAEWDHRQRQWQAMEAERQQTQAELETQQKSAMDRHIQNERQRAVEAIPELQDQTNAERLGQEWMEMLSSYGFSQTEFANLNDHRILRVLNDFNNVRSELHKVRTSRPKRNKRRRVKSSVRPNAKTANTREDTREKQLEAAKSKAHRTGNVDDVAKTLFG